MELAIVPLLVGGLVVLLGASLAVAGVGQLRSWSRLRSMSAGAVTGSGLAEVEGTAEPLDETLQPPRENVDCLAYDYTRQERQHDHDMDDDGVDTEWRTTHSESDSVPFVVDGDASNVVVDPSAANLLFDAETERRGDVKHTSKRLDVGEQVYVAGEARTAADADVATDGHNYVIERSDSLLPASFRSITEKPFVVADTGEKGAERRLLLRGAGSVVLGIGIAAVVVAVGTGVIG
jgi:hypothetical protein